MEYNISFLHIRHSNKVVANKAEYGRDMTLIYIINCNAELPPSAWVFCITWTRPIAIQYGLRSILIALLVGLIYNTIFL